MFLPHYNSVIELIELNLSDPAICQAAKIQQQSFRSWVSQAVAMASMVYQDVYCLKETDSEHTGKFYRSIVCMKGLIFITRILKQHKDRGDTPTTSLLSKAFTTIADRKSDRNGLWFGYEKDVSERKWLVRPFSNNFFLATDT
jgi:hypothetical protein